MNVVSYVVVNLALIVIWALTDADSFSPIRVIGGWGIGLLFHAWTVFGQQPITEADV
jgi:2TM domain